MQITKKRLKEIIAEEIQRFDEADDTSSATAAAMDASPRGDFHMMLVDMLGSRDPARAKEMFQQLLEMLTSHAKGHHLKALQNVIDKHHNKPPRVSKYHQGPHRHAGMDGPPIRKEAYTRTKKRNK